MSKLLETFGQQKLPIKPRQKLMNERPHKSAKFKKISKAYKIKNHGSWR